MKNDLLKLCEKYDIKTKRYCDILDNDRVSKYDEMIYNENKLPENVDACAYAKFYYPGCDLDQRNVNNKESFICKQKMTVLDKEQFDLLLTYFPEVSYLFEDGKYIIKDEIDVYVAYTYKEVRELTDEEIINILLEKLLYENKKNSSARAFFYTLLIIDLICTAILFIF